MTSSLSSETPDLTDVLPPSTDTATESVSAPADDEPVVPIVITVNGLEQAATIVETPPVSTEPVPNHSVGQYIDFAEEPSQSLLAGAILQVIETLQQSYPNLDTHSIKVEPRPDLPADEYSYLVSIVEYGGEPTDV